MFIHLMEELQEQIVGHCCLTDVKNLSQTNSDHYLTLKKYLNHTLNIPEYDLRSCTFAAHLLAYVKILRLNSVTRVPQDIYKAVSTILHLNVLDLRGVKKVTDFDVMVFSQRPSNLKTLYLRHSEITHLGVSFLTMLDKLSLEMCSNINNRAMQILCSISKLSALYIRNCNVSDNGFANISNLTELKDLRVIQLKISNFGFEKICQLSKLKSLHVKHCYDITDSNGFCNLSSLTELEELKIFKCRLSNSGFDQICTLTKLRKLDVSYCSSISDVGFSSVGKLQDLQTLAMAGTKMGDTGAEQVAQLRKLQRLDISVCLTISDGGLSMLKKVYGPCMVV